MNTGIALIWLGYVALLIFLTYSAKSKNVLLPGRVGAVVQAFAYVATYISAVALVGFAGLGHSMGMQIQLLTLGNVWLGCWLVYKYIAWPTRLVQKRLGAQTPAELISKGYGSSGLARYQGALSGLLLIIYCSAVFKGGALMLTSAVPLTEHQALALLVAIVALSVLWGGLRAVLFTEALQGMIMTVGVLMLLFGALRHVGGLGAVMDGLAALPPTPKANNGFLAVSSGAEGMNLFFVMLVLSVGMWSQPQIMQRHFALKSHDEARRIIPIVMLVLTVLLGSAYFVGGMSRLLLGPDVASPDVVIPTIVRMVLPEIGVQLFTLAVVSAALSTASAILHVSCAALGQDLLGRRLSGWSWRAVVVAGALTSGFFAVYSSSIIALICSTSWTLIAASTWLPYMSLLINGIGIDARSGWMASLGGTFGAVCWYFIGYAPTSLGFSGLAAPGFMGQLHPMLIGISASACGLALGLFMQRFRSRVKLEFGG